mmetsp:Transcript_13636/g.21498  ORF Transcript_13636/g.21498 Transcript_13636/m.21498 type:complete len:336 (+) Transcript_13636:1-1008(+)
MTSGIEVLPEELLGEIFSYLWFFADVRRVGLVCKLWHAVVWTSRTGVYLRKFPQILEGNQFQYLLRSAPYISLLQMPADTTDNHVCKIGFLLPHLKHLQLRRCRNVSDTGIAWLSNLKLEELYLSTSWNISTLDFLVQSAETLHTLELRGCDLITDNSLRSLGKLLGNNNKFYSVKDLDLRDCKGLTEEGFKIVVDLFPNVKLLDVSGCAINLQSIIAFKGLCKLEKLYLWGCQMLTDECIEQISIYKHLMRLNIIECDTLTDLSCKFLMRSTIQYLEIGGLLFTDEGIPSLLKIKNLTHLGIISNTTNITKERLEACISEKRPELTWNFTALGI